MYCEIFTMFKNIKYIEIVENLIIITLVIIVGLFLNKVLSKFISHYLKNHYSEQAIFLTIKFISYGLILICISIILNRLGLNFSAILGAAGIAGVAIGLASQTSLSNVISGLFIIGEKNFSIGDIIQLDNYIGTIDEIGLISTRLRTFDNRFIRIPNEIMIKSCVTNISKNPIRRLDINISVAYKENIPKVIETLLLLAGNNPYCLDDPPAVALFKGFGESSLNFMLGVWFERNDYSVVCNTVNADIQKYFKEAKIEIPFPQLVIHRQKTSTDE
ncbi:MAG: mechanosensitive ion channel family protein [Lentisphaeria bacterium]